MKLAGSHGSIALVPRRNSRATGPGLLPPVITPAVGRPARCTVTVPGNTGSVGDVAPHRQQASSRIWRVATSPTRVLQAPITQRCTRSVPLHPIRRSAPDQKGCNAYGSGAPPPKTSIGVEIYLAAPVEIRGNAVQRRPKRRLTIEKQTPATAPLTAASKRG